MAAPAAHPRIPHGRRPPHREIRPANQDDIIKLMSQLGELERDIFLAGCYKAFLLQFSSCGLCKDHNDAMNRYAFLLVD
jgi:predicted metal-binding protein